MATEAHLRCNKNWRLNNPEKFKKAYDTYRDNNRELVRDKDRKRKLFYYQCKILRNILLE
jgi:hypothetical protein